MSKLKDYPYEEQCLLIGQVARLYSAGIPIGMMSKYLNEPFDIVYEAVNMIVAAGKEGKDDNA